MAPIFELQALNLTGTWMCICSSTFHQPVAGQSTTPVSVDDQNLGLFTHFFRWRSGNLNGMTSGCLKNSREYDLNDVPVEAAVPLGCMPLGGKILFLNHRGAERGSAAIICFVDADYPNNLYAVCSMFIITITWIYPPSQDSSGN